MRGEGRLPAGYLTLRPKKRIMPMFSLNLPMPTQVVKRSSGVGSVSVVYPPPRRGTDGQRLSQILILLLS